MKINKFVMFLRSLFYTEDPWRSAYLSQRDSYEAQVGHLKFLLEQEQNRNNQLLESIHRYLGLIQAAQQSGSSLHSVSTSAPTWAQERTRLENIERRKADQRWGEYVKKNQSAIMSDADAILVDE